ncbi:MAG: HAMP domain-containing histidine kinase [Acidobacteria bacterium]|nr:HAMP domain-containing histidine kinase [Acidobacteriota bacterium]
MSARLIFTVSAIATMLLAVVSGYGLVRMRQRSLSDHQMGLRLQAEALSRQIEGQLQSIRNQLSLELNQFSQNDLALLPLVRNVFAWHDDRGLVLPNPNSVLSGEESAFISRFESLFGRFVVPKGEDGIGDEVNWTTWFWGDQLHMVAWQRRGPQVIGVEVEMSMLLSMVLPQIKPPTNAVQVRILDDQLRLVAVYGAERGEHNKVSTMIGSTLPHWSVEIAEPNKFTGLSVWLQVAVGSLLILTLGSILTSAWLLSQRVRRAQLDAARKSNFVSNVSHELKTPLTSIRMYAELMAEGRAKNTEQMRGYATIIGEEAQRLSRLVHNVLSLGRLERGDVRTRCEPVSLNPFLRKVHQLASPLLDEWSCELKLELLEDENAQFVTDADALEQIVWNLIDNAIKYGKPADGDHKVVLSVRKQGTCVEISVKDRGIGLAPDKVAKVFDPFYRVDDRLDSRVAGSGIGLTIARGLAQRLGGHLTYRAGEGAEFVCILPEELS